MTNLSVHCIRVSEHLFTSSICTLFLWNTEYVIVLINIFIFLKQYLQLMTANYESNQQDATIWVNLFFFVSFTCLGDIFAHHQEHLTVFTVSVPGCCRLVSVQQAGWILTDTVNTVKCSWCWAKILPKTCRADKEK